MQFHLTETTPLMQEPLVSELGNMADTSAADWILQGTYVCPPGVDWYTQEFISSLQITTLISDEDRIHTMVTCQDYQQYWKRSKECTSSSYLGLHFGHWKAVADCTYLSEVHAMLTKIVVSSGFSPTRWQNRDSVMLEGCKGDWHPNELWAILLMEAVPNKLFFGKQMMERAKAANEIHSHRGAWQPEAPPSYHPFYFQMPFLWPALTEAHPWLIYQPGCDEL